MYDAHWHVQLFDPKRKKQLQSAKIHQLAIYEVRGFTSMLVQVGS